VNTRSAAAIDFEPLSAESLRPLLEPPAARPCLSLYLPTHRNVPHNTVDRPAYQHLLEACELALGLAHPRAETERLLHPFRVLAGDHHFWEHTRDGLAILAADGKARGFLLQRPVRPLALVTDRFHLLPLVRIVSSLERFTILTLTSREAAVYEATAWHDVAGGPAAHDVTIGPLDPLPLVRPTAPDPAEPLARREVVDERVREPHRVYREMGPSGRAETRVVHGGAGSKQDEIDQDTQIFLRHVDAVVDGKASRPTGLPLLLVAAASLAATFRGLSNNPFLLEDMVPLDPHLLSQEQLAATVAPVFAAARARRIERELRTFHLARERNLAAESLAEIAAAAVVGKIAVLMVEAERFIPGRFDRETGAVATDGEPPTDLSRSGGLPAARTEDVLSTLAETVLFHGGTIVSLSSFAMPCPTGAAAIYRY
jgi:putative intracellular protease/amidase